jgi:PIN domain nuclease of toxin-antitoxin system
MRALLDTHALVWWWTDNRRLPGPARDVIADPDNAVFVSAATAWEIATKYRLGKWQEVERLVADFEALVLQSRFTGLPISLAHARLAGTLVGQHRDPFDRMLIAQARLEGAALITGDAIFRRYRVPVVWRGSAALPRS